MADVQRRVTIRDVAAQAGVSISTVSLYLQEPHKVSAGTGERIAAAVAQLGYKPRIRNGARQPALMFGLLMEELASTAFPQTFYGRAIRAIETRAKELGFTMLFSSIHEDGLPPMVLNEQVDGVIVLGGSPANDALAGKLAEHGVPLVLLDNYVPGLAVDTVAPNHSGGGYIAMQHLISLGHERIAIIEGPCKYRTLSDRLWGALRAADEHGLSILPAYRQPSISSGYPKKGYREMQQLLTLMPPPTAVFAISDRAALGAMEAIKEAGLTIPDDISLIGFDDETYGAHTTPALTTIGYDGAQLGTLAMNRLAARIETPEQEAVQIAGYTQLVRRGSTAVRTTG